jgi:hypothetical protein
MVLREVREHGAGEPHTPHAVLIEAVRGDLHRHGIDPYARHLGQEPMKIRGFRSGARVGDRALVDAHARGSDHPGLPHRRTKDPLQEVGGGRLPVGSGHPDDAETIGRVPVEDGGDRTHRRSDRGNPRLDHRVGYLQPPFHQEGSSPPLHGRRGEVVTVVDPATDTEEQAVRRNLVGSVGEARDRGLLVAAHLRGRENGEEAGERLGIKSHGGPAGF